MRLALTVIPLAALALVGCGDRQAEPVQSERGSAAGEVLGGSISDDMIPLDRLRSTSPVDPAAIDTSNGMSASTADTPATADPESNEAEDEGAGTGESVDTQDGAQPS